MTETPEEQLAKVQKNMTVTLDIMQTLFRIFKESIDEANKDKKYFLEKMQFYNSLGEALSGHLKELTEAMTDKKKDSDACKQSWRLTLMEHHLYLSTFVEKTESYRKTIAKLLDELD